ncbi:hypothetical protein DPMN_084379 [Dreissena polymorpha]|uniref:Uncharacterized protein n=1 Tax=Dreissena polymorpha TaxID=45954 RepID=A0A9D3YDQ1_DREPO|nr:hypothetical protein DPMN_084379 [Dreissena polymorpha]
MTVLAGVAEPPIEVPLSDLLRRCCETTIHLRKITIPLCDSSEKSSKNILKVTLGPVATYMLQLLTEAVRKNN